VSRAEVVELTTRTLTPNVYLEIGVESGDVFTRAHAARRIGVDPIPPRPRIVRAANEHSAEYFQQRSDDFFREQHESLVVSGIDVAFVDGLHTYQQVYADVLHCLRYLTRDGVILVHDCNPPNEDCTVIDTLEIASHSPKTHNLSRPWTGDVWKAIVRLRSEHDSLHVCVLDTDYGIGVVTRGENKSRLQHDPDRIAHMVFSDLEKDRRTMLNLRRPVYLFSVLRRLIGRQK